MMKKIKLLPAFLLILSSSKAQNVKDLFASNYISLTVPQDYAGDLSYLDGTTGKVSKAKATDVKHDKTYLGSFPNLVSSVTLYQDDGDGKLTILGNSLSAKNGTYEVIYDYTQTQTIQVTDDGSQYYALIGISVRMVARITTKEHGINLADLFKIGLAANRKKISGTLEVRTNGVNSQAINAVLPVTTDLSPASIASCLQAVATIKSHIYDADTQITPQFLAFSVIGNKSDAKKIDYNSLVNKVKTFTLP